MTIHRTQIPSFFAKIFKCSVCGKRGNCKYADNTSFTRAYCAQCYSLLYALVKNTAKAELSEQEYVDMIITGGDTKANE